MEFMSDTFVHGGEIVRNMLVIPWDRDNDIVNAHVDSQSQARF
jgi:hypothetical protein